MDTKLTIETLEQKKELYNDALQLIESSLSYNKDNSFKEDFSPLVCEENFKNCYLLLNEETLIATLFVLPRTIQIKEVEVKVGFLGGICVHESERGKGHLNYLMEEVLKKVENRFAFLALWSSMNELYQKFGFVEAGALCEIPFSKCEGVETEQKNFADLTFPEKSYIISLYQHMMEELPHIKRNEHDWKLFFDSKSMDLHLQRNEHGQVINYWVVGKGQDLKGICHETSSLGSLIVPKDTEANLWLPPLPHYGENLELKFLGMIKIGNHEKFTTFVNQWSGGLINLKFSCNWNLGLKEETFELNESDLIQGLFTPGLIQDFGFLNQYFYISGFDSI